MPKPKCPDKPEKPDFESEDNRKLAMLVAYIPALLHVKNLVDLGTPYGLAISKDEALYSEAVEFAADKFYNAAVDWETINLPFDEQ